MKKFILFMLLLALAALSLSACQKSLQNTQAAESDPLSEYWETDAYGGMQLTPEGEKKVQEQYEEYNEIFTKIEAHLKASPEGALAVHFAGIKWDNSFDDVTIRLDDPGNKEALAELEGLGIASHYKLENWSGSRANGEAAARQLNEAWEALRKKQDKSEEEKLLMEKYRPMIGTYQLFMGGIPVTLHCNTPWYPVAGSPPMEEDRQLAISLFEKYIGKYEFVMYGFPV